MNEILCFYEHRQPPAYRYELISMYRRLPSFLDSLLFIYTVIRSLFRDMDIVGVALFKGGGGDLYEAAVLLEFGDRGGTAVAHAGS